MIYRRHLAREIVLAVGLVLLAFLGLFGFFDLLTELRDVGRNGYEYHHAVGYVLLTLPGRAYELLPVCVLIGSLHALNQLARNSEITVLRTAGLSTGQLLRSLMLIGSFFVVLTAVLGEFVAPPAERAAQQFKIAATSGMTAREFRSGLWVKDGASFINVQDVSVEGNLLGLRIFEFDDQFRMVALRQARSGRYLQDQMWRLSDVALTRFGEAGSTRQTLASEDWRSGLTPELLAVLMVNPDRMSIITLYRYVNYLGGNQRKTEVYQISFWKKLVYPFASLVMLVLALPFAYLQDRRGAAGVKVFIGIMLGVGFQLLNGLFSHLAAIGGWPPALGAISPSVLFLIGAGGLLAWTERR